MSHQEKQKIFDRYAKTKGFDDWETLKEDLYNNSASSFQFIEDLDEHIFSTCDLVQKEQQKRIIANLKNYETVKSILHEHENELGTMDEEEYRVLRKREIKEGKEFLKSVESIINPENLIK